MHHAIILLPNHQAPVRRSHTTCSVVKAFERRASKCNVLELVNLVLRKAKEAQSIIPSYFSSIGIASHGA
ncbi:hypothetical protein Pyn_37600 [Prunus yedoensis var. nudiflora]|uniref:Uncharacterized protein n=1 Tax=Prunus yedoensis var. nudiflora TaxID=2094558 RepID=A0A314XZ87_PRUYE|nr:hypothetical protein Pyn_37600 [Prunus yedoensis var. nudiflora]